MKGIVFNVAEDVITADAGADLWDDLLADAGVGGAYTSLGTYDDDDLFAILRAAAEHLDLPPPDLERQLGRGAFPRFIARYPEFGAGHSSARTFLPTLNTVIHPEVLKLYPGARVPRFECRVIDDDEMMLRYWSARRMCRFAEGLALGAAQHFGETISIDQPVCMHSDPTADHCDLVVRWTH
jgi:hypothetical protein